MEKTINEIRETNYVWLTRDLKADLAAKISEALIVDVDQDGDYVITDSSIQNAVDDILQHYDVKDRA